MTGLTKIMHLLMLIVDIAGDEIVSLYPFQEDVILLEEMKKHYDLTCNKIEQFAKKIKTFEQVQQLEQFAERQKFTKPECELIKICWQYWTKPDERASLRKVDTAQQPIQKQPNPNNDAQKQKQQQNPQYALRYFRDRNKVQKALSDWWFERKRKK